MAAPAITYTFTNGTTADATEVNQNFSDIVAGITDGTKDLTMNALTVQGAATFNGAVTLGNATGDDITITGYVASDIVPKTTATNVLGGSSNTWSALYLDTAATDGGAVYFNAGTSSFVKSTADGTTLDIGGFTGLDLNATADLVAAKHVYAAVNDGTNYDEGDPVYSFTGDTNTGMYSEAADQLNFATAGAEALKIDSSGQVFKPLQAAFNVYNGSNTGVFASGTTQTVPYTTEVSDVGSNFASNTFTAPVAGLYLLSASVKTIPSSGSLTLMRFTLEASTYGSVRLFEAVTGNASSLVVNAQHVIPLAAGETVYWTIRADTTAGNWYIEGSKSTTFSGMLLG